MAESRRGASRIRVLLLDRESETRERLAAAVRSHASLELVIPTDMRELGEARRGAGPVVALVDSGLEDPCGAQAIRQLRDTSPDIRCVALSGGDDEGALVDMLAAGAVGCLSKSGAAPTIAAAIGSLDLDRVQIDRDVATWLFGRLADTPAPGTPADTEECAATIREIIAGRRYEMVFQPLVALQSGDLLGMEALARFTTGERRAPDAWLREAEGVGLRCELEEGLLRAALAEDTHLPPGAFMTVNLSPQAAMSGALARAIPASVLSRVVVEITEHQQVRDYGALAEALATQRADGLRIAVDDSGHGLSALREILRLAPDFIKLNRALVRDIDRDPTRRALAFALHSIAAQLGASVIAEGIETGAELEALRGLGVPYGQGYLIGRPRPLPEAASSASLRACPAERPPPQPILLPGRAMHSFRDASRAAFGLLERELPASGIIVAQLDHSMGRYRVLGASDGLAEAIEPGYSLPLDEALCAHMASGRGARVCPDAALDPVYGSLALQRRLDVASYVGVPLELEGAARLGSLCAIAPEPDRYDERTLEMLQALAPVLMRALDDELARVNGVSAADRLRILSATDDLTGTLNRLSFLEALDREAQGQPGRDPRKYAAHVEIDGISGVRDRYGRAVSELVVKDLADSLLAAARPGDSAGRLGDAEFGVVLIDRETPQQAAYHWTVVGQRLRDSFAKRGVAARARAGLAALDGTPGQVALVTARAAATPIV